MLSLLTNKINIFSLKKASSVFNKISRACNKDVFESTIIDIHSKGAFPSCVLSNFYKSKFILDGIKINSMEGFLQSLKTPDNKLQRKTCKLIGKNAKLSGNEFSQTVFDKRHIYWQGKTIDRFSDEYQQLLKRAYNAKFEQDALFRKALKATEGKKLIHSIGLQNKEETILTEKEFIELLNNLRKNL